MSEITLDAASLRLLAALQKDSRLTLQELADAVGLSATPCWRRMKALEESGVIRGYTALVDREKVGLHLCVVAQVSLAHHVEGAAAAFERAMETAPEVIECYRTTGDADYIVKVVVADTRAYDRFLQDKIFTLSVISNIRSNIALREVKYQTALPL